MHLTVVYSFKELVKKNNKKIICTTIFRSPTTQVTTRGMVAYGSVGGSGFGRIGFPID